MTVPYIAAYIVVVVGVFAGIFALNYTVWSLAEAVRDRAAIRRAGIGNGRALVAEASVRGEAARAASVALIVAGQIILLATNPAPTATGGGTPVRLPTMLAFLGINLAVVIMAIHARESTGVRRRLDEELRQAHADRAAGTDVHADEVRDATVTVDQEADDAV